MKKQRGDALIEAVLALTVVIVIITAVVMAVIASLNNAGYSENQNIATNYAQEGIEFLRDKKSSDYNTFLTKTALNYCLASPLTSDITAYSGCDQAGEYNVEGKYQRSIYIRHNGRDRNGVQVCTNGSYVSSKVVWTDPKCSVGVNCHKVEDASCFTNTNALPAP